MVIEIENICNF